MSITPRGSLPQRQIDTLRVSHHSIERWLDRVDSECHPETARHVIEDHFTAGFDVPSHRPESETRVHPVSGLFMPYGYRYIPYSDDYHATIITVYQHDGRYDPTIKYELLRQCVSCNQYLLSPNTKGCTCPHCDAGPDETKPMFPHLPMRSATDRNRQSKTQFVPQSPSRHSSY